MLFFSGFNALDPALYCNTLMGSSLSVIGLPHWIDFPSLRLDRLDS